MTTTDLTREQILEMQAGEECDALVADKILGISVLDPHDATRGYPFSCFGYDADNKPSLLLYIDGETVKPFKPSTIIADAWSVVEKMREFGNVSMSSGPKDEGCDEWICRVHLFGYRPLLDSEFEAFAETAALAVCRVALLTKLTTPGNEG